MCGRTSILSFGASPARLTFLRIRGVVRGPFRSEAKT